MTDLTALNSSKPLPCIDLINHVTSDYQDFKNFSRTKFLEEFDIWLILFFSLLRLWSPAAEAECFTLAAVAILRALQAFPAAPAGVGSRVVQAQLARANAVHQALVDIWKEEYGHTGLQSLA